MKVTLLIEQFPSLKALSAELLQCGNQESCQETKKKIYHDNIYSVYQLDSFGKIPPNLLGFNKVWMGEYDECLDVVNPLDKSYQTQFCWAHLNLPIGKILSKTENAVKTMSTTCGAGRPTDVKTSICMPRSCSEHDLKLALNHLKILPTPVKLLENTTVDSENGDKYVCEVTCRPVDFHPNYAFWMVTVVLGITVSICIFATVADYYKEIEDEKMLLDEKKMKNSSISDGFCKYFLAFSMLTNGRSLLRISNNPNNLKGVECIRFISFTWVVSGHIWGDWENADNPLKTIDILKTRSYEVWVNAFFSVDTFFFLSGLMLSYSFLPKLTIQKAKDPMVWFIFYLHRILRLTPAYLSFIVFYATYGPLTDFGPNEIVKREDMDNCKKYGWKNLLYINNIYEPRKNCLSISWYMAADTQMYLVSPIFLIAFLLGPISGILISIAVILMSTLLNYWLFFRFDLPLTLIQAYYNRGDYWTPMKRASYYAFSRIAWSISLSWLIFALNRGQSGLIGKFMSLAFWTPLGKLTFCAYLCHILIVNALFNLERSPPHFVGAFHTYLTKVIPSVVASCLFATIWTLLFEMPFAKLESFLLQKMMSRSKKENEKNMECTKI
ncbi:unnamed protein product [Caenorhabditis brenneri]